MYIFGWVLLVVLANNTNAAPGSLAKEPLFTKNSSEPNVFFEVDDSGSMDFDILTKQHWEACAYKGDSGACEWIQNGLYMGKADGAGVLEFNFLTNNADDAYPNITCNRSMDMALELCSTASQQYDWRVKSSAVNVLYFNPEETYQPWEKGDHTTLAIASFSAARSNPQPSSTGYGITRNLNGFVYHVWTDTHGFSGTKPSGGNKITGANGLVDWWDEHLRYTVNASSVTVEKITYNGTIEEISRLPSLSSSETKMIQQNIANWYQYARRRAFVAKSAIAKVMTSKPRYRFGLNFINNTSFPYDGGVTNFVELPVGAGSVVDNVKLIDGLFKLDWPPKGTPLRQGLDRAGQYFDNTDGRTDPIIEECQQNYSILLTDGYWNGPEPSIGDADNDGRTSTVADIAKYYFDKDLSALPNNSADPKLGHQHMETYTVAFGLQGRLTDADVAGLTESSSSWGDPFIKDSPEKIDDLWHAAFNSNARFVSASTPMAVAEALEAALVDIGSKVGSAASFEFNGNTLSANTLAYNTLYKHQNNEWEGDLLAYKLDKDTGTIATTPSWSAATQLGTRNLASSPRNIFTYNGTEGKPFTWDNLTPAQQDDLKVNPDATVSDDAKAKARLDYLKGDRSNEGSNGSYFFRKRNALLGDIVHSDPFYVGRPNSFWPDVAPFPTATSANYRSFRTGVVASRDGVIYAGANDGMLHGFNAVDGTEVMAYIPNSVFSSDSASKGLHYLTDSGYEHNYYVDMPVSISDVYIGKTGASAPDWHTVLIGGGRGGSKGLFALDITDPAQFGTVSYIENQVVWEFDETDDTDLGFTYSQPTIAMMQNGRWAAIFGNGYNNTGSGDAALYIVFLDVGDGGSDGIWNEGIPANKPEYIKIVTGSGSIVTNDCENPASQCNGLSSPRLIDLNGDDVADRVYAGDLKGNMWAFDLSSSNANDWGVAYLNPSSTSPAPLFTATHNLSGSVQPITTKPFAVKHPNKLGGAPDVLVFFGTGQYLTDDDIENKDVQSFYGIWDNGTGTVSAANLVEQTLQTGVFINGGVDVTNQVRVVTDNPIDYASGKKGWFFNLPATGERSIVDAMTRGGKMVYYNTSIPTSNACDPGGNSFLMVVKQINGGNPDNSTFDFNGDDKVDTNDLVTTSGSGNTSYAPSGVLFNKGKGMASSSSFLSNKRYTSGTDGNVADKVVPLDDLRRLSWEEIRK